MKGSRQDVSSLRPLSLFHTFSEEDEQLTAFLSDVGADNSKIDFMMVVNVGRMLSIQNFKTDVGIGSNLHNFGEEAMTIFRIFNYDAGVKQTRGFIFKLSVCS